MKRRISINARDVLLVLFICAVGVSFKVNREISVPEAVADTHFSNEQLDEECRLKMSFLAVKLVPLKRKEYHSDISWLHLEEPLPLAYLVSEDRQSYLLTCTATHHKREGEILCPVTTEKGYGLVKGPLEMKAPFSGYQNLSLREFLGIPRFNGGYIVHRMGRFNVLVLALPGDEGEDEDLVVMALNPDSDLKSLYHGLPIGSLLSEEDRAAIVSKYTVEDPFVLERLRPTWNPYKVAPP